MAAPSSTRVSQACNQCRSKKRRCDGSKPRCKLCLRLGIECSYAEFDGRSRRSITAGVNASNHHVQNHNHSRSRQQQQQHDRKQSASGESPYDSTKSPPEVIERERHVAVEATSGMASADLVTTQFGASTRQVQPRMSQIAPWNLGLGIRNERCTGPSIREIVSWQEFVRMATIYFADVHSMFGAFTEHDFWTQADLVWKGDHDAEGRECYDGLLSAVAALGSLFSRTTSSLAVEQQLSDCCARHMNLHLTQDQIPSHDVDSLLLRTLYIRMSLGPQACYIASGTLMSVIQSRPFVAQWQQRQQNSQQSENSEDLSDISDADKTRILSSRLLNAWTSNEFGRPRSFDQFSSNIPVDRTRRPRDSPVWELFELYEISEALNPSKIQLERHVFEEILSKIIDFKCSHDAVSLSRTNIAVVTFRRMRTVEAHISDESKRRLIRIGEDGLEAVERLAKRYQPWHHVANVPFQVLCLFLLLDTRESLSKVGSVVKTIKLVASIFDTPAVQTTWQIACHLVTLARKRKKEDTDDLDAAVTEIETLDGSDSANAHVVISNVGSGSANQQGAGGSGGAGGSTSSMGHTNSMSTDLQTAANSEAMELTDVTSNTGGFGSVGGMSNMQASSTFTADFSRWEEIDWNQVFTNDDSLWVVA